MIMVIIFFEFAAVAAAVIDERSWSDNGHF
jgi:hypothetical protein